MKLPLSLLAIAAAAVVVVGCSSSKSGSAAQPSATPAGVAASAGGATAPSTAPASGNQAAAAPTAAPSSDEDAVKRVVEQANNAQQQAFSSHDPSVMRTTATTDYYNELTQIQRDLENSGVTAIKLVSLEWNAVSVRGDSAQATTVETWQTTYQDGSTDQDRQQNVYALTRQDGSWKIQSDVQPDAGLQQPAGRSGAGGSGSAGSAPSQSGGAPGSSGRSGSSGSSGSAGGSGRSTSPGGSSGSSAPNPTPAPRARGSSNMSSNWSGYAATGGSFTAVSGTWTVPQVTAVTAGEGDATWVGIGGATQHDLIQAGTEATVTSSGRVRYSAWIETLPQSARPVPFTVSPGDTVNVSLTQQTGGDWLIAFENRTSGQHYQTTVTYTSSLSSAEWVEEAPFSGRGVVPLDHFGSVQITEGSAVKDGTRVTITGAGARAITMIDADGRPLATPSTLGGDGASFTVSREADASAPSAAGIGGQPGSPVLPGRTRRGN